MYSMDVLTVRLDNNISKKIDVILKEFNYSTKTDFVREAIRTKVTEFEETRERKKILKNLEDNFGKYKKDALSIEESEKLRIQAGKEFVEKLEKKFNQK
jgi:metal-responsive CopG/Arc/MetJ family transcriptional regulator